MFKTKPRHLISGPYTFASEGYDRSKRKMVQSERWPSPKAYRVRPEKERIGSCLHLNASLLTNDCPTLPASHQDKGVSRIGAGKATDGHAGRKTLDPAAPDPDHDRRMRGRAIWSGMHGCPGIADHAASPNRFR